MPYILKNVNQHPPGGFPYLESATGMLLENPGFSFINMTTAIQHHRKNNPKYGLPTTFQECSWALEDYTCARLNNDPAYCTEISDGEFAAHRTLLPASAGGGGCPGGCR